MLLNYHTPWATPGYTSMRDITGKLQVLPHTNYIIGLHEAVNLGLWVSFTTDNETISLAEGDKPVIPEGIEVRPEEVRVPERPPPCWRADPRLSRSREDQCNRMLTTELYQSKNVSLIQLFPEELETREMVEAEGHLLSNMAPVKLGYNGARHTIINAIKLWATQRQDLNVIHGPVFDYNLDGIRDSVSSVLNKIKPLVPSNYFYIVSSCSENEAVAKCPGDKVDVLSFVFPNTDYEDNCQMTDSEYLHYHLTNVKDIELLTGLRFFRSTNLNVTDSLRLRTMQPIKLWPFSKSSSDSSGNKFSHRTGKSESVKVVETL